MFEYIKSNYKEWLKWLLRLVVLTTIIYGSLYFLSFADEIIKSTVNIIYFTTLSITLSGLWIYLFTRINFTSYLIKGDDNKYTDTERAAVLKLFGSICIAVAIIVSVCLNAVYFMQFKPENDIKIEKLNTLQDTTIIIND